jgi:hypothetical protein
MLICEFEEVSQDLSSSDPFNLASEFLYLLFSKETRFICFLPSVKKDFELARRLGGKGRPW